MERENDRSSHGACRHRRHVRRGAVRADRASGRLRASTGINTGKPAQVFTPAQRALVAALSERVMPTTDTPGAIAAGVPTYIEHMLGDWAINDERDTILSGLAAIDARSMADYKLPAVKASAGQQDALLTLAMNGDLPGAPAFFDAFRQLVITGYFTSEIGITQEREFLPVPGKYDGAYPYSNVQKIFSS